MNFKDKYKVSPEFEELFAFRDEQEEIEHEAKMLMFRFFSELEKLNSDKPIKKKDLAKAIKTSPSYITQLFRGDKLVNLQTLAKIQEAYNFKFEIIAGPYGNGTGKLAEQNDEKLKVPGQPLLKSNTKPLKKKKLPHYS